MVNERFLAIADAFDELHALVASEPSLSGFTAAMNELRAVAQRVRAGVRIEVTVPNERTARIPSRELARRILAIVAKAPGPLGHEDRETVLMYARLHGNLQSAVGNALFVDYPDLMRGPTDTT
jgi:antitoxin (DNA-binding transcriptional repressor) of toxin-antitoxin stability system